ncbi:hypothetical protein AVEN_16765-1 [Araneus ventricosus]|uniref:Uncharacterized protein n=1 Tax=Araneus ventricosus TaxID=182803 RepID=A0A4Y2BPT6_ARAVE|nr:hypothetical protein AVEN_16765-1 [Araneus ventricosus]
MNIIEDIRDGLLHAAEKRSPPPRTPMELLTALQDSWCEFPPGYLQKPVESMPRRFAIRTKLQFGNFELLASIIEAIAELHAHHCTWGSIQQVRRLALHGGIDWHGQVLLWGVGLSMGFNFVIWQIFKICT